MPPTPRPTTTYVIFGTFAPSQYSAYQGWHDPFTLHFLIPVIVCWLLLLLFCAWVCWRQPKLYLFGPWLGPWMEYQAVKASYQRQHSGDNSVTIGAVTLGTVFTFVWMVPAIYVALRFGHLLR